MKRHQLLCIVAMLAASSFVLGQNADKNSAGPTKNDYRIKVIEPAEGATITGPTVRVVVALGTKREPGNLKPDGTEKRDVNTMPKPSIQVFVDNESKGMLNDPQNVLTVDGVAPGAHKLVIVATNRSGEIIDRQEVGFNSTEATASTSTSTSTSAAAPPPPPPPPPAPAASSSSTYSSTTSSQTTASTAPSYSNPPPAPPPARPARLPKTGSSAPLLAAAGLGFLAVGLALRARS